MTTKHFAITTLLCSTLIGGGCFSEAPEGIAPATPRTVAVKVDLFHRPLPEIPLPFDLATRYDSSSATGRRINASLVAPTQMEGLIRQRMDQLDGWSVFQKISIPFDGPLDVASILAAHRDDDYDLSNDVIYLVNIDRRSANYGKLHHLDLGNGNFPVVLERIDRYWDQDPRGWTNSLLFEEADEDLNGNGELDPGEDTDADGVLDRPNYLPGKKPARDDLAGRADALMTFYERETNTLMARPLVPLDERTTYAVIVTTRLKDAWGEAVGSPYPYINHVSDNKALEPLPEVLPKGLALDDVAFAFTFTTQTVQTSIKAVRDGLYGKGVQAHIGENFPAQLASLEPLRDKATFPNMKNSRIVYSEQIAETIGAIVDQVLGTKKDGLQYQLLMDSHKYIDYHVIGSFESPQLFMREDDAGNTLPLDLQAWPEDLDRVAAPTRSERVYFWLAVPRKEVSARGQGKPAPVALLGHGYTGGRYDVLVAAGHFARHGIATLAIDDVGHGIGISDIEQKLITGVLAAKGFKPFAEALLTDRAFDQNGDMRKDSGADFWTAYLFHTRDMVRQSLLDYMQLVRVLRSFDGKRSWAIDVASEIGGKIAGDFDGDGKIDVGGDAPIGMTGGSLGGMMSMLVGATEPEVSAVAPISGGGGLSDIAIRSTQGGVVEAFILRTMGPLFIGSREPGSSVTKLETVVCDLNDDVKIAIANLEGLEQGDSVLIENASNNERGCGYVTDKGNFRVSVASDKGDALRLRVFKGGVIEGTECEIRAGAEERLVVDSFELAGDFQQESWKAGAPLVALAAGLGMRRSQPDLRRFAGLAQMVIDPGDPAIYARHIQQEPLVYPLTGDKTGAHALMITTIGDTAVPVATGITVARAAGLIDYLNTDPRYGKPVNQELIDSHTTEGVNTNMRYIDPQGVGVHIDVENFGGGQDLFGEDVPRLVPPLRLGFNASDSLGGSSAAIFPLGTATGQHGFDGPGAHVEKARKNCQKSCQGPAPGDVTGGDDPCKCMEIDRSNMFDIGSFMFNMIGRYLGSGGKELTDDRCLSRGDCSFFPAETPPARTNLE